MGACSCSWSTAVASATRRPAACIPWEAERLLAAGAELVSLGRAFLANPDLVERLRAGAPLNPVREDRSPYAGGEAGYTDYPALVDDHCVPAT